VSPVLHTGISETLGGQACSTLRGVSHSWPIVTEARNTSYGEAIDLDWMNWEISVGIDLIWYELHSFILRRAMREAQQEATGRAGPIERGPGVWAPFGENEQLYKKTRPWGQIDSFSLRRGTGDDLEYFGFRFQEILVLLG
jgi:hypothetical protein